MTKKGIWKYFLILFGLLPFVYFILFFIFIGAGGRTTNPGFVILFVLMAVSIPALFVYYVIDILRNNKMNQENKLLWIALLFFGSIVIYPFYWYVYIWKTPNSKGLTSDATK